MVVENDNSAVISVRIVKGSCMCNDNKMVNKVTRKDHFALPFIN